MNYPKFTLISHHLCPYVQRAAIALLENDVPFERKNIDLANKPDWFLKLSPLGKVPLLVVDEETVLFESSVIADYINEVTRGGLIAADPLEKARQRSWIEFASTVIANIGQLYNAADANESAVARDVLDAKWQTLEAILADGPYFDGHDFSLVDAAFAPVFRYFDVFEQLTDIDFFTNARKVQKWRNELAKRSSVMSAVSSDYQVRLIQFLAGRTGVIGALAQKFNASAQQYAA